MEVQCEDTGVGALSSAALCHHLSAFTFQPGNPCFHFSKHLVAANTSTVLAIWQILYQALYVHYVINPHDNPDKTLHCF